MRSYITILLFVLLSATQVKADITNVVSNSYSHSIEKKETKKNKTQRHRIYTNNPISDIVHGVDKFFSTILGPRPSAWCGWWMRSQKGGGPEYNVARNWAKRGTNAGGPQVGAVVVWSHHVGIITGKASNGQWIVKSGNDSNRVRERARSVADAIAFRTL